MEAAPPLEQADAPAPVDQEESLLAGSSGGEGEEDCSRGLGDLALTDGVGETLSDDGVSFS